MVSEELIARGMLTVAISKVDGRLCLEHSGHKNLARALKDFIEDHGKRCGREAVKEALEKVRDILDKNCFRSNSLGGRLLFDRNIKELIDFAIKEASDGTD